MDSMRNDLKKSKNGLKAAVEAASVVSTQDTSLTALRGQLKAAERERDDAYQMILACGHCKVPEQEASEVVVAESTSTATPDTAPPAQGAESGAAKKKNKNKKRRRAVLLLLISLQRPQKAHHPHLHLHQSLKRSRRRRQLCRSLFYHPSNCPQPEHTL
ncbi:unnamed protein product [Aureobasidium pullulans]|nr:unnamed protein product [Aureobasidium pullulans]